MKVNTHLDGPRATVTPIRDFMKMQGPPNTVPPCPVNQPGGGAGGRQKESASDDLFTCVFLEEQNGLFWFWLLGRKAGRAREATSPSPLPWGDATSSHSGRGPVLRSVCMPSHARFQAGH